MWRSCYLLSPGLILGEFTFGTYNLEPVSVVFFPSTHALCIEYKNQDRSGTPYISHAVLLDGDNRVSYELQMQDDLFTEHCAEVYARNLVDLTSRVK
jgi:hypothetical protein